MPTLFWLEAEPLPTREVHELLYAIRVFPLGKHRKWNYHAFRNARSPPLCLQELQPHHNLIAIMTKAKKIELAIESELKQKRTYSRSAWTWRLTGIKRKEGEERTTSSSSLCSSIAFVFLFINRHCSQRLRHSPRLLVADMKSWNST